MNTQTAQEFLYRCFRPGETVALLLRRENPASTTQRIVTVEQATATRYFAWLRYENHNGANVYVAANPLRSGSRKRTKDCIAEVRHLYIDIDVNGEERMRASDGTHSKRDPALRPESIRRCEGFDFDRQDEVLVTLRRRLQDRNRVPGFLNRKYDPAHSVSVEYPSEPSR